jgi:hypothetical protein
MGALERLAEKFVNEPGRITPDECYRLLEMLDYKKRRKAGSEMVFHKKGSSAINVPTPKKSKFVKSPYIKRITELLRLEEYIQSDKQS